MKYLSWITKLFKSKEEEPQSAWDTDSYSAAYYPKEKAMRLAQVPMIAGLPDYGFFYAGRANALTACVFAEGKPVESIAPIPITEKSWLSIEINARGEVFWLVSGKLVHSQMSKRATLQ
jgi:hypothetical protein